MAESRPYQSERRRRQAAETRRDILQAARRLFAERGYAATPLSEVAAAAGVSVPTLYASVGAKADIARALVEFVNEEAEIAEHDRRQRVAETAPELIRANVHLVRVLNERCGDIIRAMASAAASEPEVVPALEAGRRYHREGEQAIARRLGEMGALRAGLDEAEAAAISSTLLSYEVFALFALTEGWSYDRIEDFLAGTLSGLLLRPGA
ncbi:MAG TPA: helix-turn-helix domain-containing protein [Nitrolancea sp.]|nr:helix-turn-helix domain-containing protein [Nitrolancea sp.]